MNTRFMHDFGGFRKYPDYVNFLPLLALVNVIFVVCFGMICFSVVNGFLDFEFNINCFVGIPVHSYGFFLIWPINLFHIIHL